MDPGMQPGEVIEALLAAFERDDVKEEVLLPAWLTLNGTTGIHSAGFCHAASEVLFRLTGRNDVWQVRKIMDPVVWNHGTHYFLKDRASGATVDITADQYTSRGIAIPYDLSRRGNFRLVSTRSLQLAERAGLPPLE